MPTDDETFNIEIAVDTLKKTGFTFEQIEDLLYTINNWKTQGKDVDFHINQLSTFLSVFPEKDVFSVWKREYKLLEKKDYNRRLGIKRTVKSKTHEVFWGLHSIYEFKMSLEDILENWRDVHYNYHYRILQKLIGLSRHSYYKVVNMIKNDEDKAFFVYMGEFLEYCKKKGSETSKD